ncbi:MAG TPA: AVAST type 4 anti-phage nuclease Avs4 [Methylophilaceae bacterium]|jgi:hypothetical protein
MIKPNWDVFKAKFSSNPQKSFEWFCYLLFCQEFNQPNGIFRFINQTAIETNPIVSNGEEIGWQAKFYSGSLTSNKVEILDTLIAINKYYPKISVLHFYCNQEWAQYRGKPPAGLVEIEAKAKDLNINLVWRTASYFESLSVSNTHSNLSKYFFTLDKSIINLIEDQKKHTTNILSIQECINFKGQEIEVDRELFVTRLTNNSNQVSILSGVGGVGKTAVIKKLQKQLKDQFILYVFKANEFELRNINDLFTNFSFYEFTDAHANELQKIIVIDSAEKLLDLNNNDPFKEFLTQIIKDGWKVIFTTRESYLEDLNNLIYDIYGQIPLNINIKNLSEEELIALSDKYSFTLPKDEKLFGLIQNLFYLREYLNFYSDLEDIDYLQFKNKLWNKKIKNTLPERESCFIKLALERANKGLFFVNSTFNPATLKELVDEGVLGHEVSGYFITHDIYEEWAIEKFIESEFINKVDINGFFEILGQSLPVRRCFRNWMSEKLLLSDSQIKEFINRSLESEEVQSFWKDEIYVSVLLSDYSDVFFSILEEELLANSQQLLKKLIFILRVACKEIDDSYFKKLGFKNENIFTLKFVFTKPKGKGWEAFIRFVFNNRERIGYQNLVSFTPVIYDWNDKIKVGEITRLSSLIALEFYKWANKNNDYLSRDERGKKIVKTVLFGSLEIKNELNELFGEILQHKWKNHRDPYNTLCELILTELDGLGLVNTHPEYVLALANLFWSEVYSNRGSMYSHSRIEESFGLVSSHNFQYFPASAFQTPIYWLLKASLKKTVDFIIDFTNKSISNYVNSGFDGNVHEVEIKLSDGEIKKQYISNCLWQLFRGTGSPVSPYLLQSVHMALEKYFLEIAKSLDSDVLEKWLFYLLHHTKSASISSVVTSVVLSFPDKTFNVACVLFSSREFISFDQTRVLSEPHAKSLYSIGNGSNWHDKLHYDERLKTCDDKHRNNSLESQFLTYQYFRSQDVSEDAANERRHVLWGILDAYYVRLPVESEQTDADKLWRLALARMDIRKINITAEKTKDGVAIQFNPDLDPSLKDYSEKSQARVYQDFKYLELKLWAQFRFENNEKSNGYEKYVSNPKQAYLDAKEIISKLENESSVVAFYDQSNNGDFYLLNSSTPLIVFSVLLRDYFNELNDDEKIFCKDSVVNSIKASIRSSYRYQMGNGLTESFSLLHMIFNNFPEDRENIKVILLFSLLDAFSIGGITRESSTDLINMVIQKLWITYFNDAQSILFGYLILKPEYDALIANEQLKSYENHTYTPEFEKLRETFIKDNENVLQEFIENSIEMPNMEKIESLSLDILNVTFQLIPNQTNIEGHKLIINKIVSAFAKQFALEQRGSGIDYDVKRRFFERYANFVLGSSNSEIPKLLAPFIESLNATEAIADLLNQFVSSEDYLYSDGKFWLVWSIFKPKVFEVSKKSNTYWVTEKIIKNYLLAGVHWKETAKEWRSLKENNKIFFSEVSKEIGHIPVVIYSIAKLLNGIGSHYLEEGVMWISKILDLNKELNNTKLHEDTIYHLEHILKKYIYLNKEKIKRTNSLKKDILRILDFLVLKESVVGYMLREGIV